MTRYRISLEQAQYASSTINLRLAAIRRLAYEAADCGLAIGYAASALDSETETYANVARITLDAMTAYAADVRAGRQIKGGIPVTPAS